MRHRIIALLIVSLFVSESVPAMVTWAKYKHVHNPVINFAKTYEVKLTTWF